MLKKYFNENNKLPIDPERIVVKVGSAVLSDREGRLDKNYIGTLSESLSRLMDRGKKVLLVSSGAVSTGVGAMEWERRPKTIPEKQAMAAIGQCLLMNYYNEEFKKFGKKVSQILLTRDDMDDRKRYLNTRYTLEELLKWGVLPIINENDTTTIDELRFGDNDLLSAIVATKMSAEVLIFLTDVDGLFDSNPKLNPEAKLLHIVDKIAPEVLTLAGSQVSRIGSGGMISKLNALSFVTIAGVYGVLVQGRRPNILEEILSSNFHGTLFLPRLDRKLTSRKRWIAFGKVGSGKEIVIDRGAENALKVLQKSLLPVGIIEVRGNFSRGDVVNVLSMDGMRFARGLTNYNSDEIGKIAGQKTFEIEKILGEKEYDEVIHKDNLVLL